jgi:hypothetical protein
MDAVVTARDRRDRPDRPDRTKEYHARGPGPGSRVLGTETPQW